MKNYRSLIISLCVMSFLTGIIYESIGKKPKCEALTIYGAITVILFVWFIWYMGFDSARRINKKNE